MKLTPRFRERFQKNLEHFDGGVVGFKRDRVRLVNGRSAERVYLTHWGAVGVLAFPSPNEILLVKQYRYPVDEFTYEIPAGKLAKGERPMECVKRELQEETGYQVKRIRKMLSFWPTAAFSNEVLHIYVADRLVKTRTNPDADEFLEIVKVSPAKLESMIRSGKIRDSKTIIAYLYWITLLQ